ncbi:CG17304 [Drosophila busckii]|uniref:CG17304 n=1 Tax=Drosophila busckii TaxID=30019 RepID=A0A0M3QY72_DROBS|nr:CG17304 [Drosophila busckii]
MSSGRSARLPPTPTQNANNKHRVAAAAEPNSNNMLQYSSSSSGSNATGNASSAAAASGMGMGMGMGMAGMGIIPTASEHSYGNIGTLSTGVSVATSDAATDGIPGDTIDVLGPELAVATTQVLESLSDNERKMIIEVLNRDESVRQRDATRIM